MNKGALTFKHNCKSVTKILIHLNTVVGCIFNGPLCISVADILRMCSIISAIVLITIFVFGESEFVSSDFEAVCDTGMAEIKTIHILTTSNNERITSCAADCRSHPQCTAFDFHINGNKTYCETLTHNFRSNCAKKPTIVQHFRVVISLFFPFLCIIPCCNNCLHTSQCIHFFIHTKKN